MPKNNSYIFQDLVAQSWQKHQKDFPDSKTLRVSDPTSSYPFQYYFQTIIYQGSQLNVPQIIKKAESLYNNLYQANLECYLSLKSDDAQLSENLMTLLYDNYYFFALQEDMILQSYQVYKEQVRKKEFSQFLLEHKSDIVDYLKSNSDESDIASAWNRVCSSTSKHSLFKPCNNPFASFLIYNYALICEDVSNCDNLSTLTPYFLTQDSTVGFDNLINFLFKESPLPMRVSFYQHVCQIFLNSLSPSTAHAIDTKELQTMSKDISTSWLSLLYSHKQKTDLISAFDSSNSMLNFIPNIVNKTEIYFIEKEIEKKNYILNCALVHYIDCLTYNANFYQRKTMQNSVLSSSERVNINNQSIRKIFESIAKVDNIKTLLQGYSEYLYEDFKIQIENSILQKDLLVPRSKGKSLNKI